MTDTLLIANTLGRANMARTLGVGATAISNRVSDGFFPASWYVALKKMCDHHNLDCPPELFRMKATNGVIGDTPIASVQDADTIADTPA